MKVLSLISASSLLSTQVASLSCYQHLPMDYPTFELTDEDIYDCATSSGIDASNAGCGFRSGHSSKQGWIIARACIDLSDDEYVDIECNGCQTSEGSDDEAGDYVVTECCCRDDECNGYQLQMNAMINKQGSGSGNSPNSVPARNDPQAMVIGKAFSDVYAGIEATEFAAAKLEELLEEMKPELQIAGFVDGDKDSDEGEDGDKDSDEGEDED